MVNQSIWRNQEWAREVHKNNLLSNACVRFCNTLCQLENFKLLMKRGKVEIKTKVFLLTFRQELCYFTHCCCFQALYDVCPVCPAIAKCILSIR